MCSAVTATHHTLRMAASHIPAVDYPCLMRVIIRFFLESVWLCLGHDQAYAPYVEVSRFNLHLVLTVRR